jgi:hypothetical protein
MRGSYRVEMALFSLAMTAAPSEVSSSVMLLRSSVLCSRLIQPRRTMRSMLPVIAAVVTQQSVERTVMVGGASDAQADRMTAC